jgi:hypothetical protein
MADIFYHFIAGVLVVIVKTSRFPICWSAAEHIGPIRCTQEECYFVWTIVVESHCLRNEVACHRIQQMFTQDPILRALIKRLFDHGVEAHPIRHSDYRSLIDACYQRNRLNGGIEFDDGRRLRLQYRFARTMLGQGTYLCTRGNSRLPFSNQPNWEVRRTVNIDPISLLPCSAWRRLARIRALRCSASLPPVLRYQIQLYLG